LLAMFGKTSPDTREALQWYRLAVVAADRSEDLDTQVWTRSRAALGMAYEGKCIQVANDYARAAVELSDKPTMGRLQAWLALAHARVFLGDIAGAREAEAMARQTFDSAGSYEQISDYAIPEWRFATIRSMLFARIGDERHGQAAQDEADRLR